MFADDHLFFCCTDQTAIRLDLMHAFCSSNWLFLVGTFNTEEYRLGNFLHIWSQTSFWGCFPTRSQISLSHLWLPPTDAAFKHSGILSDSIINQRLSIIFYSAALWSSNRNTLFRHLLWLPIRKATCQSHQAFAASFTVCLTLGFLSDSHLWWTQRIVFHQKVTWLSTSKFDGLCFFVFFLFLGNSTEFVFVLFVCRINSFSRFILFVCRRASSNCWPPPEQLWPRNK